ncbi:MAG: glycosyltransferase family 4 protein [Acidothermaceae bacterium]
MVRVLLDATAVPVNRGGVGRYVDNLIPALVRAGVDLRVVCQPRDVEHLRAIGNTEPIAAPRSTMRVASRLAWEQAGLPALIRHLKPDVVHAPHYTQPLATRRPLVITLHDATFFTSPQSHRSIKGPFFRAATKLALRRADCCVVPSKATATELVRVAGADAAKLQVAYLGVDARVFAPPTEGSVKTMRAKLEVEHYVAFLGTLEPRKNVPALIRGWVKACEGRDNPPALVLAGSTGWDDQIDAAVAAVPAPLTLIRLGYLPIDELAALLGGADVVAYPSLGEGFGLPVLEAMACGAAVLTTRRLALPEVGGDAVAYTEPDDISISTSLAALLDDDERRATLSVAATERAAGFTWDTCAAAHVIAYERAITARRSDA